MPDNEVVGIGDLTKIRRVLTLSNGPKEKVKVLIPYSDGFAGSAGEVNPYILEVSVSTLEEYLTGVEGTSPKEQVKNHEIKIIRDPYETGRLQIKVPNGGTNHIIDTDTETLEFLRKINPDMLLLYKYLMNGRIKSPKEAMGVFNPEVSINNGGGDTTHILYHQLEEGGRHMATYGPKDSGTDRMDLIIRELEEIESNLAGYGITIDKRNGGILIDGVALNPHVIRTISKTYGEIFLHEDGQPLCADDSKRWSQPTDGHELNVLSPDHVDQFRITEILHYTGTVRVEATKIVPEKENIPINIISI